MQANLQQCSRLLPFRLLSFESFQDFKNDFDQFSVKIICPVADKKRYQSFEKKTKTYDPTARLRPHPIDKMAIILLNITYIANFLLRLHRNNVGKCGAVKRGVLNILSNSIASHYNGTSMLGTPRNGERFSSPQ